MSAKASSRKETADFTIMLCSCDAYEDLWDLFFTLLERYWPQAKNYPFILNTESKVYQREGWNIRCFQMFKEHSKVSYGTRMIRHLDKVQTVRPEAGRQRGLPH